jgi:hypothetical protein
MTHEEFVRGYRDGSIQVQVDRAAAARLVSARMLLPFALLPVLGLGVALALLGYLFSGIAIFLGGLALRFVVRATSQGYVLSRSLQDREFFQEALKGGLMKINGDRPYFS